MHLPSGGSLVIDRTEAMTVVDVNTGKYTGSGGNLEETVTRNNLEAAEEIVRQLRLRDIGGIIVVDFIDMVLESNRELVLRRLTECLGRDRTPPPGRRGHLARPRPDDPQADGHRPARGVLRAVPALRRSRACCCTTFRSTAVGGRRRRPSRGPRAGGRGAGAAGRSEDVVARVQHTLGRRPDPRGPKPPARPPRRRRCDSTRTGERERDRRRRRRRGDRARRRSRRRADDERSPGPTRRCRRAGVRLEPAAAGSAPSRRRMPGCAGTAAASSEPGDAAAAPAADAPSRTWPERPAAEPPTGAVERRADRAGARRVPAGRTGRRAPSSPRVGVPASSWRPARAARLPRPRARRRIVGVGTLRWQRALCCPAVEWPITGAPDDRRVRSGPGQTRHRAASR